MRQRTLFRLVPIAIAAAVIAWQFLGAEKWTNPETGEAHRVALSSDQEQALGLQGYREILAQSEVLERGPEVDLVRRVAARLAAATTGSAPGFDWQVSVLRNPQVNAFCLPGGKICVYTGILPVAGDEAGLATVMGHEMAHATCRHGSQRLLQQQALQTALLGVQGAIGDMDPGQRRTVLGVLGAGAQYGVLLPFSRDHESESDAVGLMYMARAGYDPRAAIGFWERMAEASQGGQPPEFASSHPSHGTRIAQLRELMPKALAEYERVRAAGGR